MTDPTADDGRLLDPLVRRWTAIGTAVAIAGFWLLGTIGRPLRLFADTNAFTQDFFDIQAESLLHGRLSVPPGSLGIEEFVTPHGSYMYFGIVPAVLRMPIRLVYDGLDGRLGLFSCLVAVAVLGVFTARIARRAQRHLGLDGADGPSYRWYAVIAAAPVLLSPVLFLASRSMVYHEASAWGVAAAVWGIDAAMQWWSDRRVRTLLLAGFAAVVAINARPSVGLIPMLMLGAFAVLLAVRRDWRHVAAGLGAAIVAMATYSLVDLGRFGQWWGAPSQYQVSNQAFADQAQAAQMTGNSLFSLRFVPTTVLRYLDPVHGYVQPTRLFPFVAFTTAPKAVGGVPMQLGPSGSLISAAPVLVLLALVGAVWVVRRGDAAWRIAAAAGGAATLATLGFWAVWHRYLADFVPVLVVLAAPGLWLVLRVLGRRRRAERALAAFAIGGLMLLGLVGQVGLSLWSRFYFFPYHELQQEQFDVNEFRYDLDDRLFGGAPPGVQHVAGDMGGLQPSPRTGSLLIAGDCDALYIDDLGWRPLEFRSGGDRRALVEAGPGVLERAHRGPTLLALGDGWRIVLQPAAGDGMIAAYVDAAGREAVGPVVPAGDELAVDIVADPFTRRVEVGVDGVAVLDLTGVDAAGLQVGPGWIVQADDPPFCRSLLDRMPALRG